MTTLTCERCFELVSDYVEDALSLSDRLAFVSHIASCANCREGLARYEEVPGIVRSATDVRMPASVRARLRWFLRRRK
jgi:anti-sigma factor RsiW